MHKKTITILLFVIIASFSYYFFGIIKKSNFYKSDEGISAMTIAFSYLGHYVTQYSNIPETRQYFDYLAEISQLENEIFPENFHKSLLNLNPSDFEFTTDYIYIYIWLFSEPDKNKDTLYLQDLSLWDFLFRRSMLVAQYSYPSPCRPNMIYIEKNHKSFQNKDLYNKLFDIISEIMHFQKNENTGYELFSLCCFHIFFEEDKIMIENYYTFLDDQCKLDKNLKKEILSRLSFLQEQFSDYDFYIQFYIDRNR
ncbi:MAG: hypothetical protein EA412_01080 [Chitinophagaceae bacterium]|nr:MAG: hypothetical protein EA412_01080 [Chitinophagaceae bacterium]